MITSKSDHNTEVFNGKIDDGRGKITKCNCGCGFEIGSPEFYKLHVVGNELDQLFDLYEDLDSPHEPVRKQVKIKFDILKATLQGKIEIADRLKEKLVYYQNRNWETEDYFTKILKDIWFGDDDKK